MLLRKDEHNASFDFARLLAVAGIVWFHAKAPGALIGYSGLAFFLLLNVLFAWPQIIAARVQPHRALPLWRFVSARAIRLLGPWLIASAFYGGFKVIEVFRGGAWRSEFATDMWLTGTAQHLWFLPFAFAVCIALWPVGRLARRIPRRIWPWLSIVCVCVALWSFSLLQTADLPDPLAQWAYAAPIVILGVGLALCRTNKSLLLTMLALFVLSALALDVTVGLLEISCAGFILIACLAYPMQPTGLSTWCAKASLWIYLVHPAAMTLLIRAGAAAEGSILLALLTFLISVGVVAAWETIETQRRTTKALFS